MINLENKEHVEAVIKNSRCKKDVLRSLKVTNFEEGYRKLNSFITKHSTDISHFRHIGRSRIDINDILCNPTKMKSPSGDVKRYLYEYNLKEEKCEICGLENEWNNKPITLQLDHIDGNNKNNLLENLRIVCPNCHSQTPTFSGRNIKNARTKEEINLEKQKIQDRINSKKQRIESIKQQILESEIDFTKIGWRVKIGKLIGWTPQYSGKFIEKHLPEVWGICFKHNY